MEREAAAYDEAAVIRNQRPLQQWPVQIKLVPTSAPYFDGAKLLIAADCTAYAYASFHEDFKNEKIVLVGCPKLDSVDYSEKLEEIIRSNNITEVTIVRMEVPCCGGSGNGSKKSSAEQWKIYSMAGSNDFCRRKNSVSKRLQKCFGMLSFHKNKTVNRHC